MTYQWETTEFAELSLLQLYALMRLRQAVFVVEQASIYLDLDNLDQAATHMLCWEGDELLAYQRCLAPGTSYPESALGRIVVAPEGRGRDLGRELVRRGLSYNLRRWPKTDIRINAQAYLEGFYGDLGFTADSDEYIEDGIPHIQMLYRRSAGLE
ncbi:MAG: GNAT family N-acetyltransferase [Gammaproteobacteria bacterium]|nr:GNAT family N-acetyltransferase [Gammaproteobacteria bacterium]